MNVSNTKFGSALALNTSFNSTYIPLKNTYMYAISANITGTPTGTIKLQASVDPDTNPSQTVPPPTHWADIAGSSFDVSTSGITVWNVREVGYNWVRVVYTDLSSGTSDAVADLIINTKGV